MLPRISIITVLWNSAKFLPALFEGLAHLEYPRELLEMHFVDNSPGDGSTETVRRLTSEYGDRIPSVTIHEPGWNSGFAGGNNLVMRKTIEEGIPYVYLLNHDAAFEPLALREAVAVAESDPNIGSIQSLMVLQENPEEVNSRGNAIHYLGMGYCLGYHEKREDITRRSPGVAHQSPSIAYASGAAVLYPTCILQDVGCFDETLWLYHEDLDLGWRILLAGYRNVLAPKSVVRHRYEFSRSIQKWYWMERNRIAVVLKNYRLLTILLLLPQLVIADIAIFAFAIKGGWWKEKLRASFWFWRPQAWSFLLRGRAEIARMRKVPDRYILNSFTPVVAYQEFEDPFIKAVVNPSWRMLFAMLKALVIW